MKLIVLLFCAIVVNFAQAGGKYALTIQMTEQVPPALLHFSWILATFAGIIAVFIMLTEIYEEVDHRYTGWYRLFHIIGWCVIVCFAAFFTGVAFPGFFLLHSQAVAIAFDWVAFLAGTYLLYLFAQKLIPSTA